MASQFYRGRDEGEQQVAEAVDRWRRSKAAHASGVAVGVGQGLWRRSRFVRLVAVSGVIVSTLMGLRLLENMTDALDAEAQASATGQAEIHRAYLATMTRSAVELYPTAGPAPAMLAAAVAVQPATVDYDTSGPEVPYRDLFIQEGKRVDIPWLVLVEIARRESAFNPKAVNNWDGTGSRGLGQFIPGTWDEVKKPEWTWADAYDPEKNIWAMATYLSTLRGLVYKPGMSEADLVFAMCCSYNAGPGFVLRNGVDKCTVRTRNYAAGIVKAAGYSD